jgi:hypothetical protein
MTVPALRVYGHFASEESARAALRSIIDVAAQPLSNKASKPAAEAAQKAVRAFVRGAPLQRMPIVLEAHANVANRLRMMTNETAAAALELVTELLDQFAVTVRLSLCVSLPLALI